MQVSALPLWLFQIQKEAIKPSYEELRDGVRAVDPNVADYTVPAGIDVSEAQTRRGGEIEQ
jgi:hypothetical protein